MHEIRVFIIGAEYDVGLPLKLGQCHHRLLIVFYFIEDELTVYFADFMNNNFKIIWDRNSNNARKMSRRYSDKTDHGQNGPDKTDHVSGQNGPRLRTERTTFQDKTDQASGQKRALF